MADEKQSKLFKIQALTIRLALNNAQKSLLDRGIMKKPTIDVPEEYVVDLEKMYKHIYKYNLKSFVSIDMLEDALSDITFNIFLSKRVVHQRKSRSSYVLPDGIKLNRVETIVIGYDSEKSSLFNYLAQTLSREMIDFKKDSYSVSRERVHLSSEDGDNLEDNYFIDNSPDTSLLDDIYINTNVKLLSRRVSQNNPELSYDFVSLVLRLFLYSFSALEIAKTLDVKKELIQEVRNQLKDCMFDIACEESKEAVVDLSDLDNYLKDMGNKTSEYRAGNISQKDLDLVSVSELNTQMQEVLGRDYFVVAEVREYLNKRGF